jgi:hypothetical protein
LACCVPAVRNDAFNSYGVLLRILFCRLLVISLWCNVQPISYEVYQASSVGQCTVPFIWYTTGCILLKLFIEICFYLNNYLPHKIWYIFRSNKNKWLLIKAALDIIIHHPHFREFYFPPPLVSKAAGVRFSEMRVTLGSV